MRILTRGRDLRLTGDITTGGFKCETREELNGRGGWTLTLPLEHPSARALSDAADGIIVVDDAGKVEFSGTVRPTATTGCARDIVTSTGIDQITYSGVSDLGLLWRRRMIPPSGATHSVHTGDAGAALCAAVDEHLGVNAATNRRIFGLLTSPTTVGKNVTVKGRYASLGDIMAVAAAEAGAAMELRWSQSPALVFTVRAVVDTEMPLTLAGGSAIEINEKHTTDTATAVIGLGNGEGTARLVVVAEATTDPWARIETTVDARQDHLDAAALTARAAEEIALGGRSLKVEPAPGVELPKLGDLVSTTDSGGSVRSLPVVERRLTITPGETRRSATLGEPDWEGVASLVRPASDLKDFD